MANNNLFSLAFIFSVTLSLWPDDYSRDVNFTVDNKNNPTSKYPAQKSNATFAHRDNYSSSACVVKFKKSSNNRDFEQEQNARDNYLAHVNDIERTMGDSQDLVAIYDQYHCGDSDRLRKRLDAFDQIKDNNFFQNYDTYYHLDNPATALIKSAGYNPKEYRKNYGNIVQHIIHQECIDIVNNAATLSRKSVLYDYKYALVDCAESARE